MIFSASSGPLSAKPSGISTNPGAVGATSRSRSPAAGTVWAGMTSSAEKEPDVVAVEGERDDTRPPTGETHAMAAPTNSEPAATARAGNQRRRSTPEYGSVAFT